MKRSAVLVALAVAACGPSVKTVTVEPAKATLDAKGATVRLAAVARDDKGQAIEPAKTLFKPGVRQLAKALGLPPSISQRMTSLGGVPTIITCSLTGPVIWYRHSPNVSSFVLVLTMMYLPIRYMAIPFTSG